MGDNSGYVGLCRLLKPACRVTTRDIPEISETVCTEYLIMKTINKINQFQDGLNVLGINYLIKTHSTLFKRLFLHDPKAVSSKDL